MHAFAKPININKLSKVFTTDSLVSVESVFQNIESNNLLEVENTASQGFSKKIFWLYFPSSMLMNFEDQILEIRNPNIDQANYYIIKHDNTIELAGISGDKIPFTKRTRACRNPAFELPNVNDTKGVILMIDKRNASVSFPLYVMSLKEFQLAQLKISVFYGLVFGILFIVALVSLLIGFTTRQNVFSTYSIYVVAMLFYLVVALGYGSQFFYPNNIELNNNLRAATTVLLILSTVVFNKQFFRVNTLAPLIRLGYKIVQYGLLFMFLLWPILYNIYQQQTIYILLIIYFFVVLNVLVIIATLVSVYKRQKRDVYFYIFSFSALILFSLINVAIELGIVQETHFIVSPIVVGVLIEIVVMSIAIAFRYRNSYFEKILLQKEYADYIKESENLAATYNTLQAQLNEKDKLFDPLKDQFLITKNKTHVRIKDVKYVMVEGRYCEIFLISKESPLLERLSLKEITDQLSNKQFLRIHRSTAVNIGEILSIKTDTLELKSGEILPIGRSYRKDIVDAFEKK